MKDSKEKTEAKTASKSIYIKVTEDGPYLVYGQPPISEQIIVFNNEGNMVNWKSNGNHGNSANTIAVKDGNT